MTQEQLTNYLLIALIVVVAVSKGISATIDYIAGKSTKPLPKQVMAIDEIAKFVVAEAATLDLSGAGKKAKAVEDLMEQAKAEGKPITKPVAQGAVQNAYDERPATEEKPTQIESKSDDEDAKQIGFVQGNTDE
ncbi:hypothetical protein [Lactobacillus intestinalis]|uniref:hypothetical protein n=1 Tax=Lactobacillus intestinalis TaxID=151781 RepID=UPI0002C9D6FA|nr:hypothetical protein C821_000489 [Lactobacillus intestinalis]